MTNTSNTPGYRIPDNQFRSVGISPEDSVGVLHVVTESRNLQVLKPIISFDPIFVIDGHLGRDPDESISHKSMGIFGIELSIPAKDNTFVPVLLVDVSDYNPGLMTLVTGNAAKSPHVTDFIEREIFDRPPYFLFHVDNDTTRYG